MSIKILDTFEPAGEFELLDALHVGFDEDSNVDIELRNLNTKINDFTRLFNGVPTFRVSNIPRGALELGVDFSINLFVDSVNTAECRVLIKRQKIGTSSLQTFTASCYPGQEYPITLAAPKEIGKYSYSISVTNGTKRCGYEGTTGGDASEIRYEETFEITCGAASLTLPNFTKENASKIYSYASGTVPASQLPLDFRYVVAQAMDRYDITAVLRKFILNGAGERTFEEELKSEIYTYYDIGRVEPGTLQSTLKFFELSVSEIDPTAVYELAITAKAYEKVEGSDAYALIEASVVEKLFNLDIMQDNSITQTISGLANNLTTNDYLSFQFTPKTNNSNFINSNIKYTCTLYIDKEDGELIALKTLTLFPRNLKATAVAFDRFSALEKARDQGADLGNLEVGAIRKYKLELRCESPIMNITVTNINLNVIKAVDNSQNYVTKDLMLAFDFSESYDENADTVASLVQPHADPAKYNPTHNYYLKLLNARASDLKETAEISSSDKILTGGTLAEQAVETATYFTFKNGQGAVLVDESGNFIHPTLQFSATDAGETEKTGYSFEIFYKANFLGDLTAISASLACELAEDTQTDSFYPLANTGLTCSIGKPTIYLNGSPTKVSLQQDVWRHLVVVVEKFKDGSTQAKFYINGILSKISSKVNEGDISDSIFAPLALNGIFTGVDGQNTLSNSGVSSIKFVRYYSSPLSDDNVLTNFKSCYTQKSYIDVIENRNQAASTVNVFFYRNPSTSAVSASNPNSSKIKHYLDFDSPGNLNSIDIKDAKGDHSIKASKNSAVNCTMLYSYVDSEGSSHIDYFGNVDVLLQGTSSLKYPVKNYQIKVYDEDTVGEAIEIAPPGVTAERWPTNSHVYTLKCDYMEESHRNNTPTACYYQDSVLDSVIDFCKSPKCAYFSSTVARPDTDANKNDLLFYASETDEYSSYSPARRIIKMNDDEESYHPYRDAIDGIPCILYYNDNDADTALARTNININDLAANSVCVGSYMFNVDKEGPQLGFNLKPSEVSSSYSTGEFAKIDRSGKLTDKQDDVLLELSDLPCLSFEGATNDNLSAAAFIPYNEQRLLYLKAFWDKLPSDRLGKKRISFRKVEMQDGILKYALDSSKAFMEDAEYYITFSSFGTSLDTTEVLTLSEQQVDTYGNFYKNCDSSFLSYVKNHHDKIEEADLDSLFNRALYGFHTLAEHSDLYGTDTYDYIDRTLSLRFDFTEEITGTVIDTDSENELKYESMRNAIDWTYGCFKDVESDDDETQERGRNEFRNSFPKFFSFEYCLTYFMQMMLFTQVDNAGKNAMFDTWGNGKFYPRPYDMDTQMGLTNVGLDDIIPVTAELNAFFSPQKYIAQITNSMRSEFESEEHARFVSYNTANSALWKTFATCFEDEIKACYAYLRDKKVYDVNTIQRYINSKTRDIIGESYYNKDAYNKYLKNSTDLYCINGSREDRYFEFLKERITFLDTYYGYLPENVVTGKIRIRTILEEGDSMVLKTLSPMYITVEAEPYSTTCLITPSDTYTENGQIKEGSKFIFYGFDANDKNVYISNSYNLTAIDGLDELALTEFTIADVKNLVNLDISGSRVNQLEITGSEKLKKVDLSGCSDLTGTLDLSSCINIEEVDISGSGISSVLFPTERCNLKKLNCEGNLVLQSLSLKNMPNITNDTLMLNNCPLLHTVTIENCPNIRSTAEKPFLDDNKSATKHLPALTNLTVVDCPDFEFLALKERQLGKLVLRFTNRGINNLNLYGCKGNAFKILDLAECKNLVNLDLTNVKISNSSADAGVLRLSRGSIFDKLSLKNSSFGTLYTNEEDTGCFNFDTITIKTPGSTASANLLLNTNAHVKRIANLTYTGHIYSLFYNCTVLEQLNHCSLQNISTANSKGENTTSIASLFSYCNKLVDTTSSTFTFNNVVNASSLCYSCKNISVNSFCSLINSLNDGVTSIESFASHAFSEVNSFNLPDTVCFPSSIIKAKNAFAWSGITAVNGNIFAGCTEITDANYIFYSCTKLVHVNPNIFKDCCKLESIHGGFGSCSSLKTNLVAPQTITKDGISQTISLFAPTNEITNISHLFSGCSKMQDASNTPTDLNIFFGNLPKLEWAIGTFYNCSKLALTFSEDYIFSNETTPALRSTAALFAKSGLNKIPRYLADISNISKDSEGILQNYECARGMFSNIVPTVSNIDTGLDEEIKTVISSKFFSACPKLKYLGDSSSAPFESQTNGDKYYANKSISDTAGIFGNIPNLIVSTKVFSNLPNLENISRAFFVGHYKEIDLDKYSSRSITKVNECFFDDNGNSLTGTPRFYLEKSGVATDTNIAFDISQITSEAVNLFESVDSLTALKSVSYLFAGNPEIKDLADSFSSAITNIEIMTGMLSSCINYEGSNFHLLTQNKPNLSNVASLYKNCFALNGFIQDVENPDITIFSGSCIDKFENGKLVEAYLDCNNMFYGTSISGKVPANLFNNTENSTLRNKIKDTSYMFAKCSKLSGIESGYATDFNIPYKYDGTDVEYYYDQNYAELSEEFPNYSLFKTNIESYLSRNNNYNRDNWFGAGQPFDRYRNYLEQLLFKNKRNYPSNLAKQDIEIIRDITNAEIASLETGIDSLSTGLYYNIDTKSFINKTVNVYNDPAFGCYIQDIGDSGTTELYYVTSVDELLSLNITASATLLLKKDSTEKIKTKYGFYAAANIYTIVQPGLLSNCKSLTSVNYMFAGCCGLCGSIPADIFASSPGFKYSQLTSLEGLFTSCTNLTLRAIPVFNSIIHPRQFATASVISNYNTTILDPVELTSEGFGRVTLGTGGTFSTVYPVVTYRLIENEWRREVLDGDNSIDAGKYFMPKDWANSLSGVTNINMLFYGVGVAARAFYDEKLTSKLIDIVRVFVTTDYTNVSNDYYDKTTQTILTDSTEKYLYSYLKLDNSVFTGVKLQSAQSAFRCINTLGGTYLDKTFLMSSKTTLQDISSILSTTCVQQVNQPFNTCYNLQKIKYSLYRLYYTYAENIDNCHSHLLGVLFEPQPEGSLLLKPHDRQTDNVLTASKAPEFWDSSKFNSIESDQKRYSLAGLPAEAGIADFFVFEASGVNTGYYLFTISNI